VFAFVAATADVCCGLRWPVMVVAMSFVVGSIFLPESRDSGITQI